MRSSILQYSPFERPIEDLVPDDLSVLREIREGWYIEYKSIAISVKRIAKSLSAFANQYGGWLFFGIGEGPEQTAGDFEGIPTKEITSLLNAIRNASKDAVSPEVYFTYQIINGPSKKINLKDGKSILIICIPRGADLPHVHADGRIYRRVSDASDPKFETDRFFLDQLWSRGEISRAKLKSRIWKTPKLSKPEKNNSYIHLHIMSDPYEHKGHWYPYGFNDFVKHIYDERFPFDNCFSTASGFIARQASNNDPYKRLLTWEFERNCHSLVTIPINILDPLDVNNLEYKYFSEFLDSHVGEPSIFSSRILDLNMIIDILPIIIERHRLLVSEAGVFGPFFLKTMLENTWRVVPYLDSRSCINHFEKFGLPVVQTNDVVAPTGEDLKSYFTCSVDDMETSDWASLNGLAISIYICQAVGIPRECFDNAFDDFINIGKRYFRVQNSRCKVNENNGSN